MIRISPRISAAFVAAILMLGGCTAAKQEQGSVSLMERFHSGQSLIGEDRTLTAEQTDKDLTEEQREARQSYMRGLSYLGQQRRELAFEQFSRAVAQDPQLTQARYQRGLLLMEQHMAQPALNEFSAVMQQLRDFAPGYAAAGRVYFMSGLYPEAEKLFTTALQKDPNLLEAYDHLGAIHNYNREYDKALSTFQKALMLHPNASYLYNNLGLAYSMLGRDADAVEAFRKAVMQGAPSAKAYNNMGLALCRMGKYREALEAFRASGGEAAAWNNLGYFFFLDGQHERAISSFEKAIELEPTYYERAAENLKRARLAAQFATTPEHAPARPVQPIPDRQDDLFAPTAPGQGETRAPRIPAEPAAFHPDAPAVSTTPATVTRPQSMPVSPSRSHTMPEDATATDVTALQPPFTAPAAAEDTQNAVYALHASSFRSRTAAEAHAGRLNAHHMDARVLAVNIPGKGTWHRVIIGRYTTSAAANEALPGVAAAPALRDVTDLRVVNTTLFITADRTKQTKQPQSADLRDTAPSEQAAAPSPVRASATPAESAEQAVIQTRATSQSAARLALMHATTNLVPLP